MGSGSSKGKGPKGASRKKPAPQAPEREARRSDDDEGDAARPGDDAVQEASGRAVSGVGSAGQDASVADPASLAVDYASDSDVEYDRVSAPRPRSTASLARLPDAGEAVLHPTAESTAPPSWVEPTFHHPPGKLKLDYMCARTCNARARAQCA